MTNASLNNRWQSLCNHNSIILAEENDVTSETASKMPLISAFGPNYQRMFRNAVFEVGSYADIYSRNLASFLPSRSGANMLNVGGPQLNPWLSSFYN